MGATEIIFIFLIYLLFFGAKGIPSLAKTMGKAMYQFREARNDIQREIMDGAREITDSAREVRSEVEKAAQLAQKQAKKAQDTLDETLKPEKESSTKNKETKEKEDPKEPLNPLTPGDSISSTGLNTGSVPPSETEKPPTDDKKS